MSALRELIAAKRGPVMLINDVGYWSNGVKFVHVTHPSTANGHFAALVKGEGPAGRKRDLARLALMASA